MTEFKAFLATLYNMGLNKKASIQEYWNTKNISQSTPWFRQVFSRNRFQNILKFLHLVDTNKIPKRNDPNYSPASRIQPLIDFVNRKFMYYYKPRQELAVDESLMATKGRTSMMQYIPSKKAKFGVKFWMLCEAVTGYVLQINIYLGKKIEPATPVNTLQGTHVVTKLLRGAGLLMKWYHVFTDNFFSSLQLANTLWQNRSFLTGTLRSTRPMPKMIKNANPNPGHEIYARQGEKLMCAFREKPKRKPVRLITTYYDACRSLNNRPMIVNAYNTFMGGVDLSDQMMASYNDHRRSCKVWKKVVIHIFQRILLNSYILYSQNTSDNPIMSRLEYMKTVIESLSEAHLIERQPNHGRQPKTRNIVSGKIKDCTVCSDRKRGVRHRSRTECTRCVKGLHKQCLYRHEC